MRAQLWRHVSLTAFADLACQRGCDARIGAFAVRAEHDCCGDTPEPAAGRAARGRRAVCLGSGHDVAAAWDPPCGREPV